MKFLRSDDNHMDSCWITWNHPDTRMKVTVYPMLHVGVPSFYQRLSQELERCLYVLHEGVSWRSGDQKWPLYDLLARNLSLAAQETALRTPAKAIKINLDMSRSEFRARFFELPLRNVVLLLALRRLLWLVTLYRPWRREFIRYGLLRRRSSEWTEDTPLTELIVRARDRRIVDNLRSFYLERGATNELTYSAIIFGAGHLPAICTGLRSLGFRPGTRRWVEILRIPT